MAKTRTFIAVPAIDAVHACAQQAIEHLRSVAQNVKWVEPDKLHWTLQFLGDLRDDEVAEVCRRVQRVVKSLEPFPIAARGVGAFPRTEHPRTLWLGAGDGAESFVELHRVIDEGLATLGFRAEHRRFVPHLTLGRVGPSRDRHQTLVEQLHQMQDFDAGRMPVDEVVVFASRLARTGPTYTPLAHAPLEGREP